ncbi:redoxin domain-containing protein [Planctobacterium marinum]|uniref:Thioredoxin peroxidase n=1 Tax=Planctobacterium marinum TaxID=1631968 RepID=A0AA48HUF4_9ALTE|nr:thioredoxin peroxidase [Planctobacterium marinum]
MLTTKIDAGSTFPDVTVKQMDGSESSLIVGPPKNGEPDTRGGRWTIVVFYRGKHCPICTRFLKDLSSAQNEFKALNMDIVAVSGDSNEQLQEHVEDSLSEVSFPLFCELSVEDMKRLGLYISEPVSDTETDHKFSEPALVVINPDSQVQLVEIASGPFMRPNIGLLLKGLKYTVENNYPIRGTVTE